MPEPPAESKHLQLLVNQFKFKGYWGNKKLWENLAKILMGDIAVTKNVTNDPIVQIASKRFYHPEIKWSCRGKPGTKVIFHVFSLQLLLV